MNLDRSYSTHPILVIDDNSAIHEDFRKILTRTATPGDDLRDMESALFGSSSQAAAPVTFEIDYAFQGKEGLEMAQEAQSLGRPYALAFVDGRMPPGWDGIETLEKIKGVSPPSEVIMISGHATISNALEATKRGAFDFIEKPLNNDMPQPGLKNTGMHCLLMLIIRSHELAIVRQFQVRVDASWTDRFRRFVIVVGLPERWNPAVRDSGSNAVNRPVAKVALNRNSLAFHRPALPKIQASTVCCRSPVLCCYCGYHV